MFGKVTKHENIIIRGAVKIDNKAPVELGTIIVYEYQGKLFQMPDVTIRKITTTDLKGNFEIKLKDVQGSIDLRLVKDRCDWTSYSHIIQFEGMKSNNIVKVNMAPRAHKCD